MTSVLLNAGSYVSIIVLGYMLKRGGLFKASDFSLFAKVVLNLTLPAAIIVNFNQTSLDPSLLSLIAIGFLCTLLLIAIGYGVTCNQGVAKRAFAMQNMSGYNIGVFALPFIYHFVGPVGVAAICLFDVGNSVLVMGGTYAIASSVKHAAEPFRIGRFVRTVLSSPTMIVYIVMTSLALLHVHLPTWSMAAVHKVALANGFLAMLMIGIGMELRMRRSQLKVIGLTMAVRLTVAALLALIVYRYSGFPLEVRQALVLLAFAPIPASATAFTHKLEGDVALSSTLNSVAIVTSIVLMTALLLVLGVG